MKKSIKCGLFGLGLLLSTPETFAQNTSSLLIQASQNITNFSYTDSQGNKDTEYKPSFSGGYAIGYRYDLEMGMFFGVKVGMRKGGATYVYDNSNYAWDLDYLDNRLVVGYHYAFDKLSVGLGVEGYYGLLLKANQRLNNEDFDIIDQGTFNKNDYGLFISPGVKYVVSDYISACLDLNYMLGLANLETDGSQMSKNYLMGATLGLAFTID